MQRTLAGIWDVAELACGSAKKDAMLSALRRLRPADSFGTRESWAKLQAEVTLPLEHTLRLKDEGGEAAAAGEGGAARQAQLAVDVAEALATRPCANPCCTTIMGAREADAPRGKLCSSSGVVRYCGRACQKADWKQHKAACWELQQRRKS